MATTVKVKQRCQYRVIHVPAGSFGAFNSQTQRCLKNAKKVVQVDGQSIGLCTVHLRDVAGRPAGFYNCPVVAEDGRSCALPKGHEGKHRKEMP